MRKLAFVFPGQGSQEVGMGQDWAGAFAVAREAFEEADDALGFALSRLCWEGPKEELDLTANTQPAILACSVAMQRVVTAGGVVPSVAAGHSLGEYSALVATGALGFADALRLVRRRGELMQEAVPVGVGAMAALIGVDAGIAAEVAADASRDDEVCAVANLNSPQQTVLAGHRGAVERAVELAKERGAKRALLLPVSAPFHSPLMRPARDGLEPLLAATEFSAPQAPVITNVDASPVTDGATARDALVRQVDGTVRWVESMERLIAEGCDIFLEIGPGRVLTGLGRRIDRSPLWTGLPEPERVAEFLPTLN